MDISSNEIIIPTEDITNNNDNNIGIDIDNTIIPIDTPPLTPTRQSSYKRALIERLKDKHQKEQNGKKLELISKKKKSNTPCSTHIRLLNGEELFFNEAENNKYPLLLPMHILSCKLTRNIVLRIPQSIKARMDYLSKFLVSHTQHQTYPHYTIIRNTVFLFFYKEYKLRFAFKRLLHIWRLHKMNKAYVPDIDLITLAEPEKPITIYDWTLHRKFVFDAKGLANSIQSSLLYYEGCFAAPQEPKNIVTNKEFSTQQLVSIYYQLRERGELNWSISTLRKFNFSIRRWKLYHKSQLYYNALRNEITKLDTYDGRELFIDFVISRLEEYNLTTSDFIVKAYENAVIYCPEHFYIQSLKPIVFLYYESQYFNIDKSNIIRAAFMKLHKNQSKLIKHMVKHGYI